MFNRVSIVAAATLLPLSAIAQDSYRITELPPLPGGTRTRVYAMNDNGVVVGQSNRPAAPVQPARWVDGVPEELILPPPPGYSLYRGGYANRVNADGHIIGDVVTHDDHLWAYTWFDGEHAYLPMPGGFGASSLAKDISSNGVIVGYSWDAAFENVVACVWSFDGQDWQVETLSAFGAKTTLAEAIDENGVIYGAYVNADGDLRACLWDAAGVPMDLGTLGGPDSHVFAASSNGAFAAGHSHPAPAAAQRRGFLHDGVSMTELPAVAGFNNAITSGVNDDGIAVGWGYHGDGTTRPWIYDGTTRAARWRDGEVVELTNLTPPGSDWFALNHAWHITDQGRIAGWGTLTSGQQRGFALIPRDACPPDYNGDGVVDSDDLFEFLADWAAGDADYNGDGVTDSDDLFEFLSDWAAGC